MKAIPSVLTRGPFTRGQAEALGVTSRMLEGARFVRIHPRVWRHRDHVLTEVGVIRAATLALPPSACPRLPGSPGARVTGITRIQQLGLDYGPGSPLHFVVEGDLPLALDGIFLHRTVALPPLQDDQISPAAAYLAYCAGAHHRRHQGRQPVARTGTCDPSRHPRSLHRTGLARRCRGGALDAEPPERPDGLVEGVGALALVTFAGLPTPEVNVCPISTAEVTVIGDLVYERWGVVVEYEGKHHQVDRRQHVRDIARYSWMRDHGLEYVQVTQELLSTPRLAVGAVHRALVSRGYDGPPPNFGQRWRSLFIELTKHSPRNRRRAVS